MSETKTDDLLTTEQAAKYLDLSPVSLKVYRSQGKGPRYVQTGNGRIRPRIGYRREDLDAYRADVEALTATFARRAVAMTDALSKIPDAELDELLTAFMRAESKARKRARPGMPELWQRMTEWILLEYARRDRRPTLTHTPKPAAPEHVREHSPYL